MRIDRHRKFNPIAIDAGLPQNVKRLLKASGAVMALLAQKPDGIGINKLDLNTLPNGVRNGDYIKRVSDVLVMDGNAQISNVQVNTTHVRFQVTAALTATKALGATNVKCDTLPTDTTVYADAGTNEGICGYGTSSSVWFRFSKDKLTSYDITGVRAYLVTNPMRIMWELATYVDILNIPFFNQMNDLVNVVGKNLYQTSVGSTSLDGLTIVSNGTEITLNGTTTTGGYIKFTNGIAASASGIPAGWLNDLVMSKSAGQITHSVTVSGSSSGATGSIALRTKSNTYIANISVPVVGTSSTVTLIEDIVFGYIYLGANATFTNFKIKLQVEQGSVATSFEQFKENNALLSNFAGTSSDGYEYKLIPNQNGQNCDYANVYTNGDFSNGITGWLTSTATLSVSSNIATFLATALSAKMYRLGSCNTGDRYYHTALVKSDSASVILTSYDGVSTSKAHSGSNLYEKLSLIKTYSSPIVANFTFSYLMDQRTSGWTNVNVQQWMVINLNDNPIVQAWEAMMGRPITVAECDMLFAFVASTGTVKASPRQFLTTEGIDSMGSFANSPSVDITGTQNIAISAGFITGSTLQSGYILFKGLDGPDTTTQYSLNVHADGRMFILLNNNYTFFMSAGTAQANTFYDVRVVRENGVMKCFVNGVEKSSTTNTVNILSQPNMKLLARSANAQGTAGGIFFKGSLAWITLHAGENCTFAKVNKAADKICKDYRMVA